LSPGTNGSQWVLTRVGAKNRATWPQPASLLEAARGLRIKAQANYQRYLGTAYVRPWATGCARGREVGKPIAWHQFKGGISSHILTLQLRYVRTVNQLGLLC